HGHLLPSTCDLAHDRRAVAGAALEELAGARRLLAAARAPAGGTARRNPTPSAPVEHDVADEDDAGPCATPGGSSGGLLAPDHPDAVGHSSCPPSPPPTMLFSPSSTGYPWRQWRMPRSSQHCSPCQRRTQPGFSMTGRRQDAAPAPRGRSSSTACCGGYSKSAAAGRALVGRPLMFVAAAFSASFRSETGGCPALGYAVTLRKCAA